MCIRDRVTSSDTTASAPTTLGTTARAILSLLAQYPDAAPAVLGRAPLWSPNAPAQGSGAPAQPLSLIHIYIPHVFTVTSDEPARLLVMYTPPYDESPDRVIRGFPASTAGA